MKGNRREVSPDLQYQESGDDSLEKQLCLKLIPEAVSSLASYTVILAAFLIFQKNLHTAKRRNGTPSDEIVYFER